MVRHPTCPSGWRSPVFSLTGLILLILSACSVRAVQPIPLDVLVGGPTRAQPRISPDGRLLAFLAPREGAMNVWVQEVVRGEPRPLTSESLDVPVFFWQYDSRHVLYLNRSPGDAERHLIQIDVSSGERHDLTPFDGVAAAGFYRQDHMFGDPNYPNELLVSLNHPNPRLYQWYRIRLPERTLELDTQAQDDVWIWRADNHFRIRSAQAQLPDGGWEIRIRGAAEGGWRVLQTWSADESTNGYVAGFSPDDGSVYLFSSVGSNTTRLLQVDTETGRSVVVAADPTYDATAILRHPRTRALEAVWFERERGEWLPLTESMRGALVRLQEACEGQVWVESRDLDDEVWTVSCDRADAPTRYLLFDRATLVVRSLFDSRPELAGIELAAVQPISFPARDGLLLHGYLTLPRAAGSQPPPMVVLVHGGPWSRWEWGFDEEVQWLANRGYAVLQVNFRGSTGYGKKHLNAGDHEYGGKMLLDLVDGKRWAVARGFADPDRVAVMGSSYGGYAAVALLAFVPGEFACGVAHNADLDKTRSAGEGADPLADPWVDKRVGHDPRLLKAISPLYHSDSIRAPLLLARGEHDFFSNDGDYRKLSQDLADDGVPVEYLVLPGEGHGFTRKASRLRYYTRVEAFLRDCLEAPTGRAGSQGP